MAAWRHEISLLVLKHYTLLLRSLDIFQHSKRNFVSLRSHVISSIYFALCTVSTLWQKERKCEPRVSATHHIQVWGTT